MNNLTFFHWVVAAFISIVMSACSCGTPCTPGAKDCACKEANVCDEGLACSEAKCVAPTTAGVQVSDVNARGCELVLTESAGNIISDITFKSGVQGAYVREAPKVAVAFVAPADGRMPVDGIAVSIAGDPAQVTPSKVSCVDGAGQKLSNVTITIR